MSLHKSAGVGVAAVLVLLCMAGAVLAADVLPDKARSEKKKVQPLVKKTGETARDAKKAKAVGDGTTDPARSNAARSKKQHDEAEKVIDNLK